MDIVVIRCSASATVGFGHLVRCRVLAESLSKRGYGVVMVGPPNSLKNETDEDIFIEWIPRENWSSSQGEADFHLSVLERYDSKHIIIDDYRSDGEHQKKLRANGIRIVQQYDASKKQNFAANLVVNGSPYEKSEFYSKDVLYDDVEFLLGPKYCILRPIFFSPTLKENHKEKKILMTFGGGSDRGAILYILKKCYQSITEKHWKLTIIVSDKNENIKEISDWISLNGHQNIELIVNPDSMAEIMSTCRFAIMGGGTTIFEAAYLGIPALLIPIADNQINQCVGWDELGGMKYISTFDTLDESNLKDSLVEFLSEPSLVESYSQRLKTIIDEHGYQRILDKLLDHER